MENELRAIATGKMLIVGVGNILRGDDGFGPLLVDALAGKIAAELLDTGEVPESYLGRMEALHPDVILVLDALHFGAEPGAAALLGVDALPLDGGFTHRLPLALLLRLVGQRTGARVLLLGVQPRSTEFGAGMSREVRQTMAYLAEILPECCGRMHADRGDCHA